jgi:2-polyprenyl-6-methoxyphenol hydroxylase-like FAD-dependent oxidoreductase
VAGADDSTAHGQRRYNLVWYRPAAAGAELASLMSDADGTFYPEGIPPQQVSWRQVAAMREAARAKLAPQFAEVLEKAAQPFLQPIYDLVSERLAFGRIALPGDAAFVARPHVGMGVAKAGDDALALADAIAAEGATAAALQRYEARRQPVGLAVAQRARRLGAYLEARQRGDTPVRDAAQVMRETAIDPRLFED